MSSEWAKKEQLDALRKGRPSYDSLYKALPREIARLEKEIAAPKFKKEFEAKNCAKVLRLTPSRPREGQV